MCVQCEYNEWGVFVLSSAESFHFDKTRVRDAELRSRSSAGFRAKK